jgi:hypothetical protein
MIKHTKFFTLTAAMAVTVLAGGCSKPPDANATPPVAPLATANVSDIDVTEHVKTALHQNELLKGFDINVVTLKGDVRLIGVLESQTQIDEALRVARASDGTHTVHDELTLKK